MENFQLSLPTQLIFGAGVVKNHLSTLLKDKQHVLLVYGGGSIHKNGLYQLVTQTLEAAHIQFTPFQGIQPNPRVETVNAAITCAREQMCDFVLAIGGGSVIDAAKLIAVGIDYPHNAWDIVLGKHTPTSAIPIGVILTLAATGSETNSGSVITNWTTQEKRGWGSPLALPVFALLDPSNTISVPSNHTLYGIVDIMSHLFEQYFRAHPDAVSNPYQEALIEATLRQVIQTAPLVMKDLTNYSARETLMICGTYALNGVLRIGSTGDWASHQIEHALSACFDIPHGAGLAIVFPHWFDYVLHADPMKNAPLIAKMAVEVFQVTPQHTTLETALAGVHALREFWASLGAPSTMQDISIDITPKMEELIEKTLLGRSTIGNFQQLDSNALKIIFQSLA